MSILLLCSLAHAQNWPYTIEDDISFGQVEGAAVVDMDNDGDLDLVSGRLSDVVWFDNDGTGLNYTERGITGEHSADRMAVGDLDHDGDIDVVSASWDDGLYVHLSQADGRDFTHLTLTEKRTAYAAVGDVDGDGNLDVVAVDPYDEEAVHWYAGDGAGGFGPAQLVTQSWAIDIFSVLLVEDFDGDGRAEIWVTSPRFDTEFFAIYEYDGGPFTEDVRSTPQWSTIPASMKPIDYDGDGDDDLIVGTATTVELWENVDGLVVLDQVVTETVNWVTDPRPSLGDIDLDGDLDIARVSHSDGFSVLWGEGGGFSEPELMVDDVWDTEFAQLADLDCDGDLDIVWTENLSMHVWANVTNPGPGDCAANPGTVPGETAPETGTEPGGPTSGPGQTAPELDDDGDSDSSDDGGISLNCSTSGTPAGAAGALLLALALLRRR